MKFLTAHLRRSPDVASTVHRSLEGRSEHDSLPLGRRRRKGEIGHPGLPMGAADFAFVLGADSCATTRRRPTGPIAIGSCCRRGTAACCCIRCCTSPDTIFRCRSFNRSGNGEARHPATPSSATRSASRPRPATRSRDLQCGRDGARRQDARHQVQRRRFQPVAHRVFVLASDGDMMEGFFGSVPRSPGIWVSAISSSFTTTTACPWTGKRRFAFPKTSPRVCGVRLARPVGRRARS
jgi:hypothetical protein